MKGFIEVNAKDGLETTTMLVNVNEISYLVAFGSGCKLFLIGGSKENYLHIKEVFDRVKAKIEAAQ